MSIALLDVNVLLGLLWKPHDFHSAAMRWFLAHGQKGWATCPITQNGFVRILSNPNLYRNGPKIDQAIEILSETIHASHEHHFWADELSITDWPLTLPSPLPSHRHLTDAYLLQLAVHRGGAFVTFDRRMLQLAPLGSAQRNALVLLSK